MPVSDWASMMPHTVEVQQRTGLDAYAKPSYGAAVQYRARVVYKNSNVRARDGQVIVARGFVWVNGTPVITVDDRITLPDSTHPPILSVERYPDELGDHHIKVFFG